MDPHTEKGMGILIKESSIKVIDACRDSGEALLIKIYMNNFPNENRIQQIRHYQVIFYLT